MSDQTFILFQKQIHHCQLCPRMCGIDRGIQSGFLPGLRPVR